MSGVFRSILSAALLSALVLAPVAAAQNPVSVIQHADGAIVVEVHFPISEGVLEVETLQSWIDSGLLTVDLQPVPLPGPGGTVDVDAFIAEARLVESGREVLLPVLVILPEQSEIEGELADALVQLESSLAQLRLGLEELAAQLNAQADVAGAQAAAQLEAIQDEVAALAAEAAWLQAFADEATKEAVAGAEGQAALANAMIARIQSGLELMEPLLDHVEEMVAGLVPSPSPPASSQPASPTSESPMATPFAKKIEELEEALAKKQEALQKAIDDAEEARDRLVRKAEKKLTEIDEMVDEQAAIDGAKAAIESAIQAIEGELAKQQAALEEAMIGAQEQVDTLMAEVEAEAAQRQAEVEAAAEAAEAALDETIAPMEWAIDWMDSVRAWAEMAGAESLEDAMESAEAARETVETLRAIAERYANDRVGDTDEETLALASQMLDDALLRLEDAKAGLEEALERLGSELDGALNPPEDPDPEPPQDPAMDVCYDAALASICALYEEPTPGRQEITVLVTIPGPAGLPLPGVGVPGGLPVPPGGLPSTPSLSTPSVSTPSVSTPGVPPVPSTSVPVPTTTVPSPSATVPSVSVSGSPSPSGSAPPPSSTTPPAPAQFQVNAVPSNIQLREGHQDTFDVRIRNVGGASDEARLTIDMDAPATADSTQDSVVVAPGEEAAIRVRLTPTGTGAGTMTLVVTGDDAATQTRNVPVSVAHAPPAASNIVASLDPTNLASTVGIESVLKVRLENKGARVDTIRVSPSAEHVSISPANLEVTLEPGESAVREFALAAQKAGRHVVRVHLRDDAGLDLAPISVLNAQTASQETGPDPSLSPSKDGASSAGFGLWVAVGAAGLVALLAWRRKTP